MQHSSGDRFDLLVAGSGPAGSTAAAVPTGCRSRVRPIGRTQPRRRDIGEHTLPAIGAIDIRAGTPGGRQDPA